MVVFWVFFFTTRRTTLACNAINAVCLQLVHFHSQTLSRRREWRGIEEKKGGERDRVVEAMEKRERKGGYRKGEGGLAGNVFVLERNGPLGCNWR